MAMLVPIFILGGGFLLGINTAFLLQQALFLVIKSILVLAGGEFGSMIGCDRFAVLTI